MQLVDAVGDAPQQRDRHGHEQRAIGHIGQDPPFADAGELALEHPQQLRQHRLAGLEVAILQMEFDQQIEGDRDSPAPPPAPWPGPRASGRGRGARSRRRD